ncbi:hypothetical protein [Nocardia sp. CNY236]|uniref:hypothetical protein n=1 Tax=Nocardia sp. CNY236 TaxID=1169152 RepID=UPI001E519796|nr:hypothetical protein [Nocardia sp. CNY236]
MSRSAASTNATEQRARSMPASRGRAAPAAPDRSSESDVRRPRRGVTAGLLVAAVLLGGFAWIAAQRPGVDSPADPSNQAFVNDAATQEVRAAAAHALGTIYSVDQENIEAYRGNVEQVLTEEMFEAQDEFTGYTLAQFERAQAGADAVADPIAVSLLTDDRAELLVNLIVSTTKDGVAQQSSYNPGVVHMQKVDGRWLVSDIIDP